MFIKIDPALCTGCHLCEHICAAEHYGFFGPARRIRIENDEYEGTHDPVLCRQCPDPPCRKACPVEAIAPSRDGAMIVDGNRCIGCGICIQKCPFGAMSRDHDNVVVVCDLCKGSPACVKICPSGALSMEER